jgi:hypothetical protein
MERYPSGFRPGILRPRDPGTCAWRQRERFPLANMNIQSFVFCSVKGQRFEPAHSINRLLQYFVFAVYFRMFDSMKNKLNKESKDLS